MRERHKRASILLRISAINRSTVVIPGSKTLFVRSHDTACSNNNPGLSVPVQNKAYNHRPNLN